MNRLTYEQIRELVASGQAIPEGSRFQLPADINYWFELTYAQYLTIPRSILQAMPYDWQYKFAALLYELDDTFDWRPKENHCYQVTLRKESEEWNEERERMEFAWGEEVDDPLQQYRYPNHEYISSLRINKQHQLGDIRVDVTWDFARSGFAWKSYRKWCQYDVLIAVSEAVYESPEAAIAGYQATDQEPSTEELEKIS